MLQLQSRNTPGSALTVAELVRRCAPDPRREDAEDDGELGATATISVNALLRREGRTDLAPDRPLVIGGWTVPALLVRRGAIAAGALLAAGTVFGLTGILEANSRQPVVNGSYSEGGAASETADPASDGVDTASDLPTADPQAVSTATATVSPTTAPAVVPVALGGSDIARHALVPAARPVAAQAPTTPAAPTAPAARTTTRSAPTSDPQQDDGQDDDDAPHGTSTPKKDDGAHHTDHGGASHTTSPTPTTRPTTSSPTTAAEPTATTSAAAAPTSTSAPTTDPG